MLSMLGPARPQLERGRRISTNGCGERRLRGAGIGKEPRMAKSDDLFTTLRKRGLRKRVARAVADAESGGKKGRTIAREVLADLGKAGNAIRARVADDDTRRRAGKKAAATRKRNAAKRSAAAKRGAQTRTSRAKAR
jgi:hypothetical protein